MKPEGIVEKDGMKHIPHFNGVFGVVEPGVLNIHIVYDYHDEGSSSMNFY